jgi:hypothetical protein
MVGYSRLMFLPQQGTLHIEYSGITKNTAYNYKFDNPTTKILG